MPAKLIRIHPENPQQNRIDEVVKVLKDGGIIIYPTDTVYAIGCDIFNARAIEKLCRVKGIKPGKVDFSFICFDLSHIAAYAKVSNPAFKLMKRAFPGPFTFILPSSSDVPKLLKANKKTVGIRVPDHPIPRELVKALEHPIITSSIKYEDDVLEYPSDPEEIFDAYLHKVDLVIDGGFGGNIPSTVIDFTENEFIVVREGKGDIYEFQ